MTKWLAFLVILLIIPSVLATSMSITIYGTNKSNAQTNVTCGGCNNTISVQAWNTSYVKNISVNSVNASGDAVSFNISNVTGYQVQELKVNGTSINAYQAGANGMLNFSYTVVGNRTLTLSPAINQNGYNSTWMKIWTGGGTLSQVNYSTTRVTETIYQNTGSKILYGQVAVSGAVNVVVTVNSSEFNPPFYAVAKEKMITNPGYGAVVYFAVMPQYYFIVACNEGCNPQTNHLLWYQLEE